MRLFHISAVALLGTVCACEPTKSAEAAQGIWMRMPPGALRAALPALRDSRQCAADKRNGGTTCTFVIDSGFAFDIAYVGTGAATLSLANFDRSRSHFDVSLTSRSSNCLQVRPQVRLGTWYHQAGASMDPAYLSIASGRPYRVLAQCVAERASGT